MTDIITNLPTSLQIECIKYLVTPSERIILLGVNGVGKKCFIRKYNNEKFQHEYTPSSTIVYNNYLEIVRLNQRVNFAVLSGLFVLNLEVKIQNLVNQLPTRVILMASVISSISLRQIYQRYIPIILGCKQEKKFKIDIILTNTDHPRYTWRELELRTLKRKMKEFNIDSMYYVSNKTGAGFDNKYFESLYNEF